MNNKRQQTKKIQELLKKLSIQLDKEMSEETPVTIQELQDLAETLETFSKYLG